MTDSVNESSPRPYSVSKEEQALDELVRISEELGLYDLNLDSVNGSTTVSKTASEGSNPSRDAK